MPDYFRSILILIGAGWMALLPCDVGSDRIVLKDGTIEVSERVWESEKYVHFILHGTKSVEVRYAKEIVARIEKSRLKPEPAPIPPNDTTTAGNTTSAPKPVTPIAQEPSSDIDTPSKRADTPHAIDRSNVEKNRKLTIYDPHRPHKYWASRNSRHKALKDAVSALAGIYGQSNEWVVANMGEENDLGLIHSRLLVALDSENTSPIDPKDNPSPGVPDAAEKEPVPSATKALERPQNFTPHDQWPPLNIAADLQFYDPRREKRYWIDPGVQFGTLKEALDALADQYGVPVEWIESQMGDTNTLLQIHKNIRSSLVGKTDRRYQ
jgi:hypothetical protein